MLQALLLTAAVFLSLTTYVHVTKKDFSWMGGALFAGLMILIVWSFMSMLFGATFGGVGHTVFALIGALLFCGFILYDTSNLLHLYGPDDYVEASIALYLDIINLFSTCSRSPAPGRRQLSSDRVCVENESSFDPLRSRGSSRGRRGIGVPWKPRAARTCFSR